MEIEEVFKSPFKLFHFTFPPNDSPINLPGLKYIYQTEEIKSSTTTEEIFNLSQMYLKQKIEEFNRYQIEGERIIITTYKLCILLCVVEKDIFIEYEEKDLYDVTYNVEEEEKYIIKEKKYYLPPETKERNFFIRIVPTVYFFREGQTGPDEVEEEYHIKKSIKSTECVICLQNRPNVLYIKCRHIVACDSCDLSSKLLECPICRTKIKDQRMKI